MIIKKNISNRLWCAVALLSALVGPVLPTSLTASSQISIEQPGGTPLTGSVIGWGSYGVPIPAFAQSGVTRIAAGGTHGLALKQDGGVVAWGTNDANQSTVPGSAQTGIIAIAAGFDHSMALKSDGGTLVWGSDSNGQRTVPATAQSGVAAISAGSFHSVALKSDGSVVAWGYNNAGQSTVPTDAQSGVAAIAAGGQHTLALKDGKVLAWGNEIAGQTTVPVEAQSGVTAIAAGSSNSAALKNGGVIVWGNNSAGQNNVPTEAQSEVIAIECGNNYIAALKSSGKVVFWGQSGYQLQPVPASAQAGIVSISAGDTFVVAMRSPAFAFPGIQVSSTGAPVTFTLKNTGQSPLTITDMSLLGGNSSDFAINTGGTLPVVPAGGQTTFTATFTASTGGPRQTTLRILSNAPFNGGTYDILLGGNGLAPEMSVSGNSVVIADGDLTPVTGDYTHLGAVLYSAGTTWSRTFSIANQGPGTLFLPGTPKVVISGEHAGDFSVTTEPSASVATSGSTTFQITFRPGAPGPRNAAVSIANNDSDENPYNFSISGSGVAATADTDSDGMADWTEQRLEGLGFFWNLNQTSLVNTFHANAAIAGFYSKEAYDAHGAANYWGGVAVGQNNIINEPNTYGLYTASQVQALNVGAPLLTRGADGSFSLDIAVQRSTDLTTYQPFPLGTPGVTTTVGPDGKLNVKFSTPGNAAFFRLESK